MYLRRQLESGQWGAAAGLVTAMLRLARLLPRPD